MKPILYQDNEMHEILIKALKVEKNTNKSSQITAYNVTCLSFLWIQTTK